MKSRAQGTGLDIKRILEFRVAISNKIYSIITIFTHTLGVGCWVKSDFGSKKIKDNPRYILYRT
jgi:hypothetical protein